MSTCPTAVITIWIEANTSIFRCGVWTIVQPQEADTEDLYIMSQEGTEEMKEEEGTEPECEGAVTDLSWNTDP